MLQLLICNYKCTFRTRGDTTNSFCSSCSSSTEENLDIKKNFLMSCCSTDLLFVVVVPKIPLTRSKLKHQKLVKGPWSSMTSFKWLCKCMFGVITCFPYNVSTDLQNFKINPSAMSKSV